MLDQKIVLIDLSQASKLGFAILKQNRTPENISILNKMEHPGSLKCKLNTSTTTNVGASAQINYLFLVIYLFWLLVYLFR